LVESRANLVVLSAMKMESEFKAARQDGRVAEVRVEAGQTVDARQVMVDIGL
jgi:biotin carboxyl carrier protein